MAAKQAPSAAPDASMRVVVLHGKDGYLLSEHLKRLRAALEDRFGGVDEFRFEGASVSVAALLDELRSWGLMHTHKLVVLDSADEFLRVEERRRALERYCAEPMSEATLVLRAGAWRPGNLDKIIMKTGGAIVRCDPPDDAKAEEFCVKRAPKRYGVRIEPAAAELLVERIGPELARLDTELGKLAAMVGDRPDGAITRADVAEMVGVSREEQAWAIQDALLTGDPVQALTKLEQLLRVAQVPEQLVIWSMVELSRKVHDAARLFGQGEAEFAIGKTLKLWGPSQSAILGAARRMPASKAAKLLDDALGLDRSVRRGVTKDLPRRLQCFAVELTDSLRR